MRIFSLIILTLLLAMATQSAQAKLVLVFDDPSTEGQDLVIEDNGPFDDNTFEGAISYCVPAGANFPCAQGFSKGEGGLGSAEAPQLQLQAGPMRWNGNVDILLTDTDFTNGPTTGQAVVNGVIEGFENLTLKFWADSANQPYGMGALMWEMSVTEDGDFLKSATVEAPAVGSLTLEVNLESAEPENIVNFQADLILPSSEGTVSVPDVVGDQQTAAEQKITDAGLKVGGVTTETSQAPAGQVTGQSPDAGAAVSPGSSVDLVVSAGSAPEEVSDAAGLAGLWYDPAFDGEGFNVLVGPDSWFLYYYGWRSNGQRLWLLSESMTGSIFFGQSITLGMSIAKSGTFADPDPSLQAWGVMTIIFDSCTAARAYLQGDDGTKTVNLVKLLGIDDLDCGP